MAYTITIEKFHETYAEMEPLYRQHFAEMRERKADVGIEIGDYALDTEGYFAYSESGQLISFIARHEGEPVGYIHAYLTRDHRTGEIIATEDSVFVLPEHRNGLGRDMVKFVLEYFKRSNVRRVIITSAGDKRLPLLLTRMGFKTTGIEMTYAY